MKKTFFAALALSLVCAPSFSQTVGQLPSDKDFSEEELKRIPPGQEENVRKLQEYFSKLSSSQNLVIQKQIALLRKPLKVSCRDPYSALEGFGKNIVALDTNKNMDPYKTLSEERKGFALLLSDLNAASGTGRNKEEVRDSLTKAIEGSKKRYGETLFRAAHFSGTNPQKLLADGVVQKANEAAKFITILYAKDKFFEQLHAAAKIDLDCKINKDVTKEKKHFLPPFLD